MIELSPHLLRRMPLPDPKEGDKNARGNILVIAGSVEVPGAAVLAGISALRAGAGRLRVATCRCQASLIGVVVPEALVVGLQESDQGGIAPSAVPDLLPLMESADAVLIGPGLADQKAIDALTVGLFKKKARPQVFYLTQEL